MAKKEYPGLVLVPPSDRTILRRRLLRWSLLLIPVVWLIWTVLGSPPASQDTSDCQEGRGTGASRDSAEDCGHSESVTATVEPKEHDFNLTPPLQVDTSTERQPPVPAPTQETHQPPSDSLSQEVAIQKPPEPKAPSPEYPSSPSNEEKSAPPASARKPAPSPPPDAHLAERGDAFAQYRLGKYYEKHKGHEAPESARWYKKASAGLRRLAENGNGQAMYVLGVMYTYGKGVARNTEEARRWLKRAVEQNVSAAQPVLASLEAKQAVDHRPKDKAPSHTAAPKHSIN